MPHRTNNQRHLKSYRPYGNYPARSAPALKGRFSPSEGHRPSLLRLITGGLPDRELRRPAGPPLR